MVTGFTKLFGTLITSTIWRESDKTRIVWITMLALADRNGEVAASVPGLAALANVEIDQCREALEVLGAPDPDSRTETHGGRRIEKIEGGWVLLNYAKYRELGRAVDRTEYLRKKQQESRARRARGELTSTSVNQDQPISEAEAEAKGEQRPAPPHPIATELRPGPVTGHELKRLFAAIREREVPGTLPWQTPIVRDGKDTSMAEMINADPTARADVATTMTLLLKSAEAGQRGNSSKLITGKPAFGFACWISDWTSLREELRGSAGRKKTKMELAQEAEAASWANR